MIPRWVPDVLMAVMEALWLFAGVAVFTQIWADGRASGPLTLVVAGLLAIAITRLLRSFDFSQLSLAATGGVISLLAIYGIVRLEYSGDLQLWDLGWVSLLVSQPGEAFSGQAGLICGAVAIFAFWMRWGLMAQDRVQPGDVRGSFGVGLIVFTIAVLARKELDEGDTVVQLVLPFLACGLLGMAIAQQVETGKLGGLSLTGSWGLAVAATLGGIFVLAGVAALVPESGLSEPLVPVFEGILLAGGLAILVFALPLIVLTEIFLYFVPIEGLAGDLPEPNQVSGPLVEGESEGSDLRWLFISARVLGVIMVGLLLIAVLASLFLYLRRRREEEAEKESLAPAGSVIEDILSLLKTLRPRGRSAELAVPDLDENGLALRQLYLKAIEEAGRRGAERLPGFTPRQFRPALERVYPGSFGAEITGEFERARYGRAAVTDQRVEELRRAWQTVAKRRA